MVAKAKKRRQLKVNSLTESEGKNSAREETADTSAGTTETPPTVEHGNKPEAPEQLQSTDDEMDLGNFVKPKKKRKKGIIYVSNIPKHMNVTRIREILGQFGKIGRVYLQLEKVPGGDAKNKKKGKRRFARHFTEGWVEFESKRVAKQIVPLLNNKQISTRKKSQFYDSLWSMKYLPRFKWTHLTERMNYEQAVHKQRLMTEVSQARKETTFFQNNLDKSEYIKKKSKRLKKKEETVGAQIDA